MTMKTPPTVSPQEWKAAREALLVEEKALTHARDTLAAKRRRMPRMAVEKDYEFEGADGPASLLDLFEGRRQLILYRGREAVAAFLRDRVLVSENRWRLVPARANGQPAVGNYRWSEERQSFLPRSISVLTLDGEGIAEITTFLAPELLSSFGLPDEVRREHP